MVYKWLLQIHCYPIIHWPIQVPVCPNMSWGRCHFLPLFKHCQRNFGTCWSFFFLLRSQMQNNTKDLIIYKIYFSSLVNLRTWHALSSSSRSFAFGYLGSLDFDILKSVTWWWGKRRQHHYNGFKKSGKLMTSQPFSRIYRLVTQSAVILYGPLHIESDQSCSK